MITYTVAKWLKTRKKKLKETLVKTYAANVDYIIISNLDAPRGHQNGGVVTRNSY